MTLLLNLYESQVQQLRVGEAGDIQPSLLEGYKEQWAHVIAEYAKQAKGPYKAEAVVEVFQTRVLEDVANLVKDVETSFQAAFTKTKLLISEYTRSEAKLQSLIDQSQQQLQHLESEKEELLQEKTALELELDALQRQIKSKDDEKANLVSLKQMELQNLRANQEKKLVEKAALLKHLGTEVEQLREGITKNQELVLALQKTKMKDVSQLKNQYNIMKESLEQSKKKLQENAELMAVNSLFKKLKVNFDEIKVMISELHDMQSVKQEYFGLQKELQEKELRIAAQEYRLRLKHDCEVEEVLLRHRKQVEDLEVEQERVQHEIQSVEDAIAVIQNEHEFCQS